MPAQREQMFADMTAKAIAMLKRNNQGFILLVEGGLIDHGHHAGNAARALEDAVALAKGTEDRSRPALVFADVADNPGGGGRGGGGLGGDRVRVAVAGTITGTLTDPTGAVVSGATVTLKNIRTSLTRNLATTDAGVYVSQFMQPGEYEITASKQGFAKMVRGGLILQVGQTLTIDFALPLQTTTDIITVNGEAPIVDTEKTEMSQVVSQTLLTFMKKYLTIFLEARSIETP